MVGAAYNCAVSIDYQRNTTGCLPFSPTALDPRIWCLNGDGKWFHIKKDNSAGHLPLYRNPPGAYDELRRPGSATTGMNGNRRTYRNDSVDKMKLIINESVSRWTAHLPSLHRRCPYGSIWVVGIKIKYGVAKDERDMADAACSPSSRWEAFTWRNWIDH